MRGPPPIASDAPPPQRRPIPTDRTPSSRSRCGATWRVGCGRPTRRSGERPEPSPPACASPTSSGDLGRAQAGRQSQLERGRQLPRQELQEHQPPASRMRANSRAVDRLHRFRPDFIASGSEAVVDMLAPNLTAEGIGLVVAIGNAVRVLRRVGPDHMRAISSSATCLSSKDWRRWFSSPPSSASWLPCCSSSDPWPCARSLYVPHPA